MHGERMIKRTFEPEFRIRLHSMDMSLSVDLTRQLGRALPIVAVVEQLMNAAISRGDGDDDHSGLLKTIEAMAGGFGKEV